MEGPPAVLPALHPTVRQVHARKNTDTMTANRKWLLTGTLYDCSCISLMFLLCHSVSSSPLPVPESVRERGAAACASEHVCAARARERERERERERRRVRRCLKLALLWERESQPVLNRLLSPCDQPSHRQEYITDTHTHSHTARPQCTP